MNDLSDIISNFNIENFLDTQGIAYRKTEGHNGLQFNIKECPFCGASKWKVYMNAETGLGNCFSGSCEQRFSKYTFVKKVLDASDSQTVNFLKENSNNFFNFTPNKIVYAVEDEVSFDLPESYDLPIKNKNLKYLLSRGVNSYYTKFFKLKFCKKGFFVNKECMQDFSNRIIIPIYDLDGVMKTFQGRDITGSADKRYLFPSGLPGTARFLYNGYNCIHNDEVIINEGVFDVIATKMMIDEYKLKVGVVGTFGKHLSASKNDKDDQLKRLLELKAKKLKRITIMWDGEFKAYKDAIEAADKLFSLGFVVFIARLPQGKDPNEVHPLELKIAYEKAVQYTKSDKLKLLVENPYECN